jgi:hypothetical protein
MMGFFHRIAAPSRCRVFACTLSLVLIFPFPRNSFLLKAQAIVPNTLQDAALCGHFTAAGSRSNCAGHIDRHCFDYFDRRRLSHRNRPYICHIRVNKFENKIDGIWHTPFGNNDYDLECHGDRYWPNIINNKNITGGFKRPTHLHRIERDDSAEQPCDIYIYVSCTDEHTALQRPPTILQSQIQQYHICRCAQQPVQQTGERRKQSGPSSHHAARRWHSHA